MTQYEAVIKVMENNGGFATLKYLNENALKVHGVEWKTKTPFASIRKIVQDSRFFFRIKPGLWALNSYKSKLPNNILGIIKESKTSSEKEQKYTHYYYQGLLAEIGTLHKYQVYIPAQDKNKPYLNKNLKDVTTLEKIPCFTYDHIIKRITSIDVIWLNNRNFPVTIFEVEHSTNFINSLNKFHELIDFCTRMVIVSDKRRMAQFKSVSSLGVYKEIINRVRFYDYEYLENYYSNPFQYKQFLK